MAVPQRGPPLHRAPTRSEQAIALAGGTRTLTLGVRSLGFSLRSPHEHLWLVTFMDYDLGYFDDETCRLEPSENGPKVLPLSSE